MFPTLRQLRKLTGLIMELHSIHISFSEIKIEKKFDRPMIVLVTEPINEVREPVYYYVDWQGRLL